MLSVIKLHFYCRKQMFKYIESLSHVSLHPCVCDHQACVLIICLLVSMLLNCSLLHQSQKYGQS